jgi:hypothetical protein
MEALEYSQTSLAQQLRVVAAVQQLQSAWLVLQSVRTAVIVRLGGAALEENAILPETLQVVALGRITIKVVVVLRPSPFPLQAAPTVLLAVVEAPVEVPVEVPVEAVVVAALGRALAAVAVVPPAAAFSTLGVDLLLLGPLVNKILAGVQKAVAAVTKEMALLLKAKPTGPAVVVVVVVAVVVVVVVVVDAVVEKDAAVLLRPELIVFADLAPHLLYPATVSAERFMSRRVRLALGVQKAVNVTNALTVIF